MTLYLNFRSQSVGGTVVDPYLLEGDGTVSSPVLRALGGAEIASRIAGKNVLFAVHGFNVSYQYGACSLGQLEPQLGLGPSDVFIGVLWPGDYWLPVVNYPFEGAVSMDCGRRLAEFCRHRLAPAQSLSFVSHSLGARLVLEAVAHLDRPARVVCLTAAAINQDCLTTEYAGAAANSSGISVLASHSDWVLKVAFRIGDPISDVLHDDHRAFESALGYNGPPSSAVPPVAPPWQIADACDYGHGNYLPPGDVAAPPAPNAKWPLPAGFMARAFRGRPQTWP
jgi:hypothetical protein